MLYTYERALQKLQELADPERAALSTRYFKTGKGQYGENDVFMGISMPTLRVVAKDFIAMPLAEIARLLGAHFHEARLLAVILLGEQYRRGDRKNRENIYRLYLNQTPSINNWDLVDASAHLVVGPHIYNGLDDEKTLFDLAQSTLLWDRRIAMVSTWFFIRNVNPKKPETLAHMNLVFRLAATLLADQEDLMHKAVGWMLREAGKRNEPALREFLAAHYTQMPRTALRYAIEKYNAPERKRMLAGDFARG